MNSVLFTHPADTEHLHCTKQSGGRDAEVSKGGRELHHAFTI